MLQIGFSILEENIFSIHMRIVGQHWTSLALFECNAAYQTSSICILVKRIYVAILTYLCENGSTCVICKWIDLQILAHKATGQTVLKLAMWVSGLYSRLQFSKFLYSRKLYLYIDNTFCNHTILVYRLLIVLISASFSWIFLVAFTLWG